MSQDLREILPCIVKLETVHSQPSYVLPWQAGRSLRSTSSGFIISNRRIVTNAHCVAGAAQVRIRRPNSARKFEAKVVAVGRDCDLAILSVSDETFWTGKGGGLFIDLEQRRNLLPDLEERVSVVGFPTGGDSVSVTSGVVSRIEMTFYLNGIHRLLAIQVDAAVNAGNSGGPVFDSKRRFVGIAFQSLVDMGVQNVGYIIPIPVIRHFLEDLRRHKRYTGFPSLMIETQGLENPAMRRYLGLPEGVSGVLVTRVQELSPCKGQVEVGDVIVELDGIAIADDHTVDFSTDLLTLGSSAPQSPITPSPQTATEVQPHQAERIDMEFIVSQHLVGDLCTLTLFHLVRGPRRALVTLTAPQPLIPTEGTRTKRGHEHLLLPSYRIVGGLVLTVLTDALLGSDRRTAGASIGGILAPWFEPPRRYRDEEAVIVGHVLAHGSTVGYEGLVYLRLRNVNGVRVTGLKAFSETVDGAVRNGMENKARNSEEGRYLRIEFEKGPLAVLDTWTIRSDTAECLELHMVPSDRSEDLVERPVVAKL